MRPQGVTGWALTVLAAVSWLLTAAVAFYMLRPVDYTGIGRLGWVGFLYPLQLAVATPVAAALAALAWRRRARAAAGGFAVVAVLTAVLALWPSVSLWQRARQYHVPPSLGEARFVAPGLGRGWHQTATWGYATVGTGASLTLDLWRPRRRTAQPAVPWPWRRDWRCRDRREARAAIWSGHCQQARLTVGCRATGCPSLPGGLDRSAM